MTEIDLKVVGKSLWDPFEKMSEAIVHEFHQQNWVARLGVPACPQVLYDVGVSDARGTGTPARSVAGFVFPRG